eukprot:TRINITY_DN6396_c0_g1_i2.p1 TRINITY_DN6396_c0_g1~~TRINITY_DN6396_c0_g1_i2.p1  ORF type:complete len:141 (-),score=23.88 TRINITY_DN6396_c0_g1_i2:52-474(-)
MPVVVTINQHSVNFKYTVARRALSYIRAQNIKAPGRYMRTDKLLLTATSKEARTKAEIVTERDSRDLPDGVHAVDDVPCPANGNDCWYTVTIVSFCSIEEAMLFMPFHMAFLRNQNGINSFGCDLISSGGAVPISIFHSW